MITLYETCELTYKPIHISVETAVNRIKTGRAKDKIAIVRGISERKERNKKKAEILPCYSWSGTFGYREDMSLIKHSGLVCIDFDHLGERLPEFKKWIIQQKYTHIAFTSPSGDGLKIIIKIFDSINTHKLQCEALKTHFNEETLDSFTDVSRLCFDSYDPEIYFNPTSERFEGIHEEKKIVKIVKTVSAITDYDKVYSNLKVWKEKRDSYVDDNKYKFLVSFSGALNRFGVPEDIAVDKLQRDYLNAASYVDPQDYVDIVAKIYKNYHHEHATQFFDQEQVARKNDGTESTEAVFDLTLPAKDIIYLDAIEDKMIAGFYNGYTKGTTTYFKTIDPHFTWLKKDVIVMTGIMNHGKSQLMMQLALMKSIKEGVKWGVFSPEQDPPDYFYNDLIHTYIGKNVDPFYKNQMSFHEYRKGLDFIKEHFFYIYPENNSPSPEYINERFGELIVKHKIGGCITDPFNQLDHYWTKKDPSGRDDRYIGDFLKAEKRFAITHDLYKVIVAHPKGSLKKKQDGNYPSPDIYDLAGGAMWGNGCDDVLVTYRPYYSTDKANTEVIFISLKIKKQKIVGIAGEVTLGFDRVSNRFLENGISPFEPQASQNGTLKFPLRDFTEPTKIDDDADAPF